MESASWCVGTLGRRARRVVSPQMKVRHVHRRILRSESVGEDRAGASSGDDDDGREGEQHWSGGASTLPQNTHMRTHTHARARISDSQVRHTTNMRTQGASHSNSNGPHARRMNARSSLITQTPPQFWTSHVPLTTAQ